MGNPVMLISLDGEIARNLEQDSTAREAIRGFKTRFATEGRRPSPTMAEIILKTQHDSKNSSKKVQRFILAAHAYVYM